MRVRWEQRARTAAYIAFVADGATMIVDNTKLTSQQPPTQHGGPRSASRLPAWTFLLMCVALARTQPYLTVKLKA